MRAVGESTRLDTYVFAGAFSVGLLLYGVVRIGFGHHQFAITAGLISVMGAYALVVVRNSKLRVRLDQAGDNAYYLGLLFTLMSMVVALYDFGSATTDTNQSSSGVLQIISNFGIALATTITGIFLRVLLSQMRVDPADFERVSRIELSDAAHRVRATLDNVSIEMGEFHRIIRQRSDDITASILKYATDTVGSATENLENRTKQMLDSVANSHKTVLTQTQELTALLEVTAGKAKESIDKLSSIEAPPLTLSRRLARLTEVLESVATQTEQTATRFDRVTSNAESTSQELVRVGSALAACTQSLSKFPDLMEQKWTGSIDRIGKALDTAAQKFEEERRLLTVLEAESKKSVAEAKVAQDAAVEVLARLTQVARGITNVLEKGSRRDA